MAAIQEYFDNTKTDTCWEWRGMLDKDGYGRRYVGRRRIQAHRAVYEALVGPIPSNMTLDHTCRNRKCVNPNHMEVVTNIENIRRMHLARKQAS